MMKMTQMIESVVILCIPDILSSPTKEWFENEFCTWPKALFIVACGNAAGRSRWSPRLAEGHIDPRRRRRIDHGLRPNSILLKGTWGGASLAPGYAERDLWPKQLSLASKNGSGVRL
jgi:hypothetical protein